MSENIDPKKPKDMIDFQEGSVVSKTIIEKDTGNVTLFAFDKGEKLSEHTAPFDAMVQVIEGQVKITISGKSYTVKQEEMIIMPANEPHGLKANEQVKILLTMIKN